MWENPSPCAEWTAREVASHVIGGTRAAVDRLDGVEHVTVLAADVDPVKDWATARQAVEAALADPARADRGRVTLRPIPFEALADRLLRLDTLIQSWDLARATGGDERIAVDAAAEALEQLAAIDDDFLRGTGAFKPAVLAPRGVQVALVGAGATAVMDIGGELVRRFAGVAPLDYRLLRGSGICVGESSGCTACEPTRPTGSGCRGRERRRAATFPASSRQFWYSSWKRHQLLG